MTKQLIMLQRECFNRTDFFVGPSRHDVARSHRVNTRAAFVLLDNLFAIP